MADDFDYRAVVRAAVEKVTGKKPPKDSPGLNPTPSRYMSDAWYLFASMIEGCDYPTAKFIFEKCIKEGAEVQAANAKRSADAQRRAAAKPMKLPTITQIDAAARHQICVWWARLGATDQAFSEGEKRIIHHLAGRYVEVGGYTKDFDEIRLPPIPQMRNRNDAALLVMFDRSNPQSAYSIERERHGGKLKVSEFAASLVPEFGGSASHIMRKVKYARIGR
jgi:hypothetical protein